MKYTAIFLILAAIATNLAVVTVLEPRRYPGAGESASSGFVFIEPGTREFHNGGCHLLSSVEGAPPARMRREDAEDAGYHACGECFRK
jgi:hypothetical protein